MGYRELKQAIKEAVLTQFNLFDEPEVTKLRKPRRKMSEKEKEERREERELKKKIEADKEFERKWAERGVFQGYLFDDEGEPMTNGSQTPQKPVDESSNSGIHINPENKGKFNATKRRTGKSTEELTHSKNPLTKKRAIFVQNAKRWSKKK